MMPLDERLSDLPPMPGGLQSMVRLFRFGFRHEPRLLAIAAVVNVLAALPDALVAVFLKVFSDGVQNHDRTRVVVAGILLGVAAAGTWLLSVSSTRVRRRFRDRISVALQAHVADLQARIATVSHQERPDILDRLSMLRNQVFVLDHLYDSALSTAGWIIRLAVTGAVLASVSPWLLLILVAALPTVASSSWRPAVERSVEERSAPRQRLARHLLVTLTTAEAAKEIRVLGVAPGLELRRETERQAWYVPIARTRWASAGWYSLGWLVFGLGYAAGIWYVTDRLHASAGDVLLVLAAGSRLSSYIQQTVAELGFLRGFWLDGSKRLLWLENYADFVVAGSGAPAPDRIRHDITLSGVSFTYPGSTKPSLQDVSLTLPAGSVVAVVGENGAGKSTLVKLLCKLYEPSAGSISVDGAPLAAIDPAQWRERLAGAFQDFARFEFSVQQSVGLGDLPFLDDEPTATRAVTRAGAADVVERLPEGLATQLGAGWPGGADLSIGQWQKVALARGFARQAPLLLVLDEPTSALDAETEHALFERYADAAARTAGLTVLVSHRFSTVRMADLIVVLDGAHVAEVGTHDDLVARGGTYAELYAIQAAAYG